MENQKEIDGSFFKDSLKQPFGSLNPYLIKVIFKVNLKVNKSAEKLGFSVREIS